MSDDIDKLTTWLAPLLQQLGQAERTALARTVARELRADNTANIRAQHGPEGEAWAARKNAVRDKRGRVRAKQQELFRRITNRRNMQDRLSGRDAVLQFVARTERIARVHHFGLRDKVRRGGPDYDYPERPLIGFSPAFLEKLQDIVLAHLAGH